MTLRSPEPTERERDACLDDEELARIFDNRSGTLDAALAHASWCDACRSLLAMIARMRAAERDVEETAPPPHDTRTVPTDGPATSRRLQPGQQIGRFVIERPVGEGGMGVVFCADDTTLQRRVALKLLHVEGADKAARKRLLREAQAMARVDHPNVVRVYEASTTDELAFIVMEFVDGMDLRHWLRAEPRSWTEVVFTYAAAGRGLGAAHSHGLVHRDFKPHNVLVARDGRVLVTDFGLARAVDAPKVDATGAGGTPRYMAPEQRIDAEVGPAADQFAFCTALREALLEPRELVVPPALLEVLARGTQRRPRDRFDTMDTLVRALERVADAPQRRRRAALGVLALVGVSTLGFAVGTGWREDACSEPETGDFAAIWDDERRVAVRSVLEQPRAGEDAWTMVSSLVDDYTAHWSVLRREACEATVVRAEVSEAVLDRRMACLGRGKLAVRAMVDLLVSADDEAIGHAIELAHALPSIDRCLEIVEADTVPPPPADAADRIAAAESELAAVLALCVAGRAKKALLRAEPLREEARAIGWAPLYAEVLNAVARAQGELDAETARETARLAYRSAIAAGSDRIAYEAAIQAVGKHAWAGRIEDADLFYELAQAHVERLGAEPVPGKLAIAGAAIARRRGDMEGALALLEEAEGIASSDPSRLHVLAGVLGDIGGVQHELGRLAEALEVTERAVQVSTEAFGRDHQKTLGLRANRAMALHNRGSFGEAEQELRLVLERQRRLEQPIPLTITLTMLASTLRAQSRYEDALALDEEALQLRRTNLGDEHPLVVESLLKIGSDAVPLGKTAVAITNLRSAIEIAKKQPYDHPLFDLYAELAYAYQGADDLEGAIAAAEEGLPRREAVSVVDRRVLRFDYRYGQLLGLVGRHAEAAKWLGGTLPVLEASRIDHRTEAFIRFHLGLSQWELGEHAQARTEVERARVLLDTHDDREHETWREIEAWLAAHPR
jgi:tetratricopeptide (TPR) repeat protein/predicted Ser/Thr protein kinase